MAYLRSSGRRSVFRSIADHNPFYLLSAACMLLACLLLSNTMTWSPIVLRKLLILIVTLNVYELLLVGLGLYLVVKRRLRYDGMTLLVLELLFVVDVGFLNSEVYQESLRVGLIVNGLLLLLAAVKLGAIFRALGLSLRSPQFALVVGSMVILLSQAGILRYISQQHGGRLPELAMYLQWWGGGLLAVGFALIQSTIAVGYVGRSIYKVFSAVLLLSLIAHLGTSHWVYASPFSAPDLSPVLLAIAVLLASVAPNGFIRRNEIALLCLLLPIAAVCLAGTATDHLVFRIGRLQLSPIALTLAAAYLTVAYTFFARYFLRFAMAGAAMGIGYVFGPSINSIERWANDAAAWASDVGRRLLPQTQAAWGFITLAGSFILLGIGAAVSLNKKALIEQPIVTPPPLTPEDR